MHEVIDKSMIVIGDFAADAVNDAEKIVQGMLTGMGALCKVDTAGSKQDIALANFETLQKAMPCIRSQRNNPVMKPRNLQNEHIHSQLGVN